MTDDWQRLGRLIQRRRKTLVMSQIDLAEAAGVGRSTVQKLEKGTARPEAKTLRLLERALHWRDGGMDEVLAGGEPTAIGKDEAVATAPPVATPLKDRLPTSIIVQLEAGEIYATDTYDLTQDGGTRMIVVVVRDPDDPRGPRDPEKLRRDNRAWSRAQRKLRGLRPLAWEPGDPWEPDEDDTEPSDVQ